MHHTIRTLAIAAAGLLLTACNMVISDTPVFTAADAAKGPGFKPGLWVQAKAGCVFDASAKAKDWPECADPMRIEPTRMVDPAKPAEPIHYVLAPGDPAIMQVKLDPPDKGKDVIGKALSAQFAGYAFAGVRPTRTDASGLITEAETWIVMCGPPPPEPVESKGAGDYATRKPFPGLKVNMETSNCAPKDGAAVRGAAKGSRTLVKPPKEGEKAKGEPELVSEPKTIRWVRDGKD